MSWFVYILECRDGSFYTGITNDLDARIAAHESGQGAKYTRGRGPLVLRYSEEFETRSEALKREYAIKRMGRGEKIKLLF